MKKPIWKVVFLALLIFVWQGCGQKVKDAKETVSNLESISEAAENFEESIEKANERIEERREKGDTLAIHYEELAKFLPESLKGYEKYGDLDGGTQTMPGMGSFSQVSQDYQNDNGEILSIMIMDYNAAYTMYVAAMAAFTAGFESDTPQQRAKGFRISDDIAGWQEYEKQSKDCRVFAGVVDRFYIEIEAENQENEDFVKKILIDEMPLDELSKY